MKSLKAFTLVELLVVISIIALLLSILMPSLNKAREQAYRVVCGSNLKQIVLAMEAYASKYDGWYPVHSDYMWEGVDGSLMQGKFLKSDGLFQCPADNADFGTLDPPLISSTTGEKITERSRENYRTYAFNVNYWGWQYNGGWRKQQEVRRPITTILVSETPTLYNILYENSYSNYFGPVPPNLRTTYGRKSGYTHYPGSDLYAASRKKSFVHGKGCNFGFADGHSEYIMVDIEEEFPPFNWFDNGLYDYNRWPRYNW